MATFYDPGDKTEQIFTPFGPPMGYCKMSDSFVTEMNKITDAQHGSMTDYSNNLVGKVKQELLFTDEMNKLFSKEFSRFIGRYIAWQEVRNSFGKKQLDTETYKYGIELVSGWIVRQHEHDYNPIHLHTSCKLSCVGYLSLPEGIDEEWKIDYQDHHPSHGHIQFVYGTASNWSLTNFMVRPRVGDFYVFPSDLFHCVYPFYTKGERRSFSVNMNFIQSKKETVADVLHSEKG